MHGANIMMKVSGIPWICRRLYTTGVLRLDSYLLKPAKGVEFTFAQDLFYNTDASIPECPFPERVNSSQLCGKQGHSTVVASLTNTYITERCKKIPHPTETIPLLL